MRDFLRRNAKGLKLAAWVLIILAVVILFITKIAVYIAPFIVAIIITFIIEKPVKFLEKRLKFPRGAAVGLILLLFTVFIGGIFIFLFYQIIVEMWRLANDINVTAIKEILDSLITESQDFYFNLPTEIAKYIENNLGMLVSTAIAWLQSFVIYMLDIVKSLPQMFAFIVISLVATFFMSRDRNTISDFIFKQIPNGWKEKIRSVKGDLFYALIAFIKAQLILMTVTFVELLIGFSIIGVKYSFFFALITALVDALPVLGTGTILIPVAAVYLLLGSVPKAFAFTVLYIIILAIRQFLEPKVVGGSLGLHPLVTLVAIYVGLQFFGLLGLLMGPFLAIIVKSLQKAGILPNWKG